MRNICKFFITIIAQFTIATLALKLQVQIEKKAPNQPQVPANPPANNPILLKEENGGSGNFFAPCATAC